MKVVIFDMDGVIVDTEPVHFEAMAQVLADHDAVLPESLFRTFVGKRAPECYGILKHRFSLPETVEQLIQKHDQGYARLLREKILTGALKPMKGLVNFLQELLDSGFAIGLVSSSPRWQIDLILDRLKLDRYFEATVAGDEVTEGKPNPEGFLLCAEKLSVQPQACVVFEDSPWGIEAAARCSMKTVALASPYFDVSAYCKADYIVRGFHEISVKMMTSLMNRP